MRNLHFKITMFGWFPFLQFPTCSAHELHAWIDSFCNKTSLQPSMTPSHDQDPTKSPILPNHLFWFSRETGYPQPHFDPSITLKAETLSQQGLHLAYFWPINLLSLLFYVVKPSLYHFFVQNWSILRVNKISTQHLYFFLWYDNSPPKSFTGNFKIILWP